MATGERTLTQTHGTLEKGIYFSLILVFLSCIKMEYSFWFSEPLLMRSECLSYITASKDRKFQIFPEFHSDIQLL